MIKYPNNSNNKTMSSLQKKINSDEIQIGERVFINKNPFTLVHIDGDKYIFSMDELITKCEWNEIPEVLKEIYTTGKYKRTEIFPKDILSDIDFLFVPTEKQVFGRNEYGEDENVQQFNWFKRGGHARIKGILNNNRTSYWWLSTKVKHDSTYCCGVSSDGILLYVWIGNSYGVPVFFQMTKK